MLRRILGLLTLLLLCSVGVQAYNWRYTTKEWKNIARHSPDSFFVTDEAARIAENVLLYQRCTGGWLKNKPLHKPLTDSERAQVAADKSKRNDSTTDNDATITELLFLARYYRLNSAARVNEELSSRVQKAFIGGVEYLLSGQYDNGGWPQFWPEMRDYQVHITYNDNAMANTMFVIHDIIERAAPYDSIAVDTMDARLQAAFDKGIACILATQIVTDGQPTVWCQQHDRETLKPTNARAFELASYCSQESVKLVELLMLVERPDSTIIRAIEGAMAWFDKYKLTGIRTEHFTDSNGKEDVRVVEDANAPAIWARYYDLERCQPFFCDRDGVPVRTLAEVGQERRAGYSWYSDTPRDLSKKYAKWKRKQLKKK